MTSHASANEPSPSSLKSSPSPLKSSPSPLKNAIENESCIKRSNPDSDVNQQGTEEVSTSSNPAPDSKRLKTGKYFIDKACI